MSMDLIARALEADDDSDSQCEESTELLAVGGSDVPVKVELEDVSPESAAMGASLQATSQPLVASGEETVISQRSRGPGKTPALEITPPKKKRKGCPDREGSQVEKRTATVKASTATDRMVHCLFEEVACIPLWPQYDLPGSKTTYVKVAPCETWLVQYIALRRKNM